MLIEIQTLFTVKLNAEESNSIQEFARTNCIKSTTVIERLLTKPECLQAIFDVAPEPEIEDNFYSERTDAEIVEQECGDCMGEMCDNCTFGDIRKAYKNDVATELFLAEIKKEINR